MSTKEQKCVEILKQIVKPNMITVDIGACLGFYTLILSDIVGEGGKVYSVEPVPSNISHINKLLVNHKFKNITVDQCAIGNTNGKIKMLAHKTLPWMGHVNDPKLSKEGHNRKPIFYEDIEVEMQTLDSFQEKHKINSIDFIKIDIEGGEVLLLDGMTKALEQPHITIYLELHFSFISNYQKDVPKVINTFSDYGLKITHLVDKSNTVYLVRDTHVVEDVMKHHNKGIVYLFFRK